MTALYWTLGILAGLVFLSWLITRLNLEVDVATGERRLSRTSTLGRYYDFITFDFLYFKWDKLTTCTVGRRLLVCTLVFIVFAALAFVLLASAVFTAYWIIKFGFVNVQKTDPQYMHSGLAIGSCVWVFGLGTVVVSLFTRVVIPVVEEWWDDRRASKVASSTKQESVVLGWYRSVRDGVCRNVKVVE